MKLKTNFVPVFILLLLGFSALAGQESIPGQRPLLLLDNAFQFISGSWADYTYFDKQKNESTRLYFSILDRETVKNAPYIWMEIEAAVKDAPVVVTRVLIEEKKAGPFRIDQAIVQVQGYSPFSVPQKYLEGQDQQVGQFQTAHIVSQLAQQVIEHNGKKINAITAEAATDKGDKMSITYSLELPPIAVYQAENKDFRLSINDWGMDAKSKINGPPESFLLWVMEQVNNAISKSDKTAPGTQSSAGEGQTDISSMSSSYDSNCSGDVFKGGQWCGSQNGSDWLQLDFGSPRSVSEVRIKMAGTDVTTDGARIVLKLKTPNGEWVTVDEMQNTNINRTNLTGGATGNSIPVYRKVLATPVTALAFRIEFTGNGWFMAQDIQII